MNAIADDIYTLQAKAEAKKNRPGGVTPEPTEPTSETPLCESNSTQANTVPSAPPLAMIRPPKTLRELKAWLTWKYVRTKRRPKPLKVPYYANGNPREGTQGTPEDRDQLATFEDARDAAINNRHTGVGLALLDRQNIVAGDFDNCLDEKGEIHPDVARVIAGTYAEYSPSGKGIRAFWTGNLGRKLSNFDEPFGIEIFSITGYVTFTGNSVDLTGELDDTIAPLNPALLELFKERTQRPAPDIPDADGDPLLADEPVGATDEQIAGMLRKFDPDDDYHRWIRYGQAIHHERNGDESGFALWDEWSAEGDKYDEDELRKKWDSFGNRNPGQRVVTLRTLMHDAKEPLTVPADPTRFTPIQIGQLAESINTDYLIKGILPRAELAVLYGPSTAGKSFAALDMCFAIARGCEWRGRRVKPARVVYICAEGAAGFNKRVKAYQIHTKVDIAALGFFAIADCPNFLSQDDKPLALRIAEAGGADLIVVDTFAQVTPGANENASEDMGKALAACKALHRATGATILVIHHQGKDASKGARGWSGLRAAADAELLVDCVDSSKLRTITITKSKDGADGGVFPFRLKVIPIGFDEDGDEVDSCVIEATDEKPVQLPAEPRGKNERIVAAVVRELTEAEHGSVTRENVIRETAARIPRSPTGRDRRVEFAKKALDGLIEQAIFSETDGVIHATYAT